MADNGLLAGLTSNEMRISLETLRKMAAKLGSEATVVRERHLNEKVVAEILVRKVPDGQRVILIT